MSDTRGPTSVSFDITNKCNLRCLHCYNNSGEKEDSYKELTDTQISCLIKDIIIMQPFSFCFCGGEPLLRKDILLESIKSLSNNGIICSLVSNGMLLTEEYASELKNRNIHSIQISLDGDVKSHNQLRNNEQAYANAIKALAILQKIGIKSGVAFSPTKWNIEELDKVYIICEKYNVTELRIQELMPIGRAEVNEFIIPTANQYSKLRKKVKEYDIKYRLGFSNIRIDFGDPIHHLISYANNKSETNTYTESISIMANGGISSSLYLPLSIGNIKKYSILEYWNKGLENIWSSPLLIKLAASFYSVSGMQSHTLEAKKHLESIGIVDGLCDLVEERRYFYDE